MKGHTKTSSVISPISHRGDLSCDNMTALSEAKHWQNITDISVITSGDCEYFALHCIADLITEQQQQTVTSRHSHIWLENHSGREQTKTWKAGPGVTWQCSGAAAPRLTD